MVRHSMENRGALAWRSIISTCLAKANIAESVHVIDHLGMIASDKLWNNLMTQKIKYQSLTQTFSTLSNTAVLSPLLRRLSLPQHKAATVFTSNISSLINLTTYYWKLCSVYKKKDLQTTPHNYTLLPNISSTLLFFFLTFFFPFHFLSYHKYITTP